MFWRNFRIFENTSIHLTFEIILKYFLKLCFNYLIKTIIKGGYAHRRGPPRQHLYLTNSVCSFVHDQQTLSELGLHILIDS